MKACRPNPTTGLISPDTFLLLLMVCLLFLLAACAGNSAPPTLAPTATLPPTPPTEEATVVPTAPPTHTPATPPPTATAPPAPAATPTPANAPSPTPAAPAILAFAAAPTTTQRLGETITFSWQAQGDRATLCPFVLGLGGPAPLTSACADVPPVGSRTVSVTESELDWDGMLLRVTSGAASVQSVVTLTLGCQGLHDWFFADPPARCPQGPAITTSAAAQRFQRGLLIWFQQPDRFYIFYDEPPRSFHWIEPPYRFNPGASPHNRVGETPPAGLFEPVSGFGQLWRGEFEGVEDLRARLGWASEPEFGFTTHYQCARSPGRLWTCFLAAPDGQVLALRPDSSAQARFLWEEW